MALGGDEAASLQDPPDRRRHGLMAARQVLIDGLGPGIEAQAKTSAIAYQVHRWYQPDGLLRKSESGEFVATFVPHGPRN